MESITKNRQSLDTLRAMVARAYGDHQVPQGDDWATELGFGLYNVAYRIRLRDGAQVVVKIAPPSDVEVLTYERGAMATEVAALRLLRERTTVPVPDVHFSDDSHELCDADYFFMPFIDADNLGPLRDSMPAAERVVYNEAIGQANREINSVVGDGFGPLTGPLQASWRAVFLGMAEDVLRDGQRRSVDLGWDYELVRGLFSAHADCLDEVLEPRLVEWDLWEGNVMVREGKLLGIIDHERALWGDPLIEVLFTGIDLPEFGDPAAFMRGYGQKPLIPGEQQRRRLYSLHVVLVLIIETVYRGHTDPGQYDWARKQLDQLMTMFGHRAER
ncbi:aminoglycoside phosphotransferase family protein [Streptomyces sp. NBC_01589]|uniref:phosphotransferase family protein n=1 Tax=Streptomyces sp. NBC_01589 TaxID=2975886 RepID=UPI0038699293